MNIIRKLLGFQKLQDEEKLPKFTYKVKYQKTCTQVKLHPTLEGLLNYLYDYGRIAPLCRLVPNATEKIATKGLIHRLRKGQFTLPSLEVSADFSKVVLFVIKKYLKHLPKCLWKDITEDEWVHLARYLPKICDSPRIRNHKSEEALKLAENMMSHLKPWNRIFSWKLLMVMNQMTTRCTDGLQTAAALRMAELFVPVLIFGEKKTHKLDAAMKSNLEMSIRFMIMNADIIFPTNCFDYKRCTYIWK